MLRIQKTGLAELLATMRDLREDQVPFAVAKALTVTALSCKAKAGAEMARVFDRPTQYTLNSIFVRSATKRRLEARVWIKDDAGKGTPAEKYLLPEVEGGQRRAKRSERALQQRGLFPSGVSRFIVPGSGAKLDAHGNVSRGQVMQVLSVLQAAETRAGFLANRTERSKRRKGRRAPEYFVGAPGGGKMPIGVWQRFTFGFGSAVRPIFIFPKSAPHYTVRYRFFDIVAQTAQSELVPNFRDAYNQALATARR